jgi:hypothetical protein
LDVTRDQTDAVLRDQQLVSGKVVTAIHSLYMRSKLGMRGAQKVGQLILTMPPCFSVGICVVHQFQ